MACTLTAAAQESYTLNIYNEGGGKTVLMQDLIDLVHTLATGADVKWDLAGGILQIQTDTQLIQVLSRTPTVIINGEPRTVSRPVLVRQEGVYIPIETVRLIFGALGVNFEIQDEPGEPTPTPAATPAPTPTPGVPAVPPVPGVPLNQSAPPTPMPTPMPTATPAFKLPPVAAAPVTTATKAATAPTSATQPALAMATAPAVPIPKIQPNYQAKDVPPVAVPGPPTGAPLEAPPALAGKLGIGLSWSQLADLVHRTPPRRVTVVLDAEMRAVGDALTERLRQDPGIETNVVAVNNARRDSEGLVTRVTATQPELVLDLVSSPLGGRDVDGGAFRVWTVNEALWPRDREAARGGAAAADGTTRYRRHQFQSLALGSLLKYYLYVQFPSQTIDYELAPSYLLRRMDAPAATILVPGDESGEQRQKLVEAIGAAVGEYVRGMMRFSRP